MNQVEELYTAIAAYYQKANQSERLCLKTFKNLGHELDLEAAKNSLKLQQDIAELQRVVAAWFIKYLY
ncbi:MAG: hypothetical protein AAFW70_10125 [Cyanobacteria bacterium J06635_10]